MTKLADLIDLNNAASNQGYRVSEDRGLFQFWTVTYTESGSSKISYATNWISFEDAKQFLEQRDETATP